MKKSFFKRIVSSVCAAAMLAGTFAGVTKPASAAGATLGYWPEPLEIPNEYYYENQTLQPYGSCFQIDELKNWSPDNDPDARYNRGAIPLRERWMGPSVNPLASRDGSCPWLWATPGPARLPLREAMATLCTLSTTTST